MFASLIITQAFQRLWLAFSSSVARGSLRMSIAFAFLVHGAEAVCFELVHLQIVGSAHCSGPVRRSPAVAELYMINFAV